MTSAQHCSSRRGRIVDSCYIVEFDCASTDMDGDRAFEVVLGRVADWLSPRNDGGRLDAAHLIRAPGSVVCEVRAGSRLVERRVTWRSMFTDSMSCVVASTSQPLNGSEVASFVSTVTVCKAESTQIRVEMGRETQGVMRPATIEQLRRPGIVGAVLRDPLLRVRWRDGAGQIVTGEAVDVGDARCAAVLGDILGTLRRLPVLVIDAGDPDAKRFGRQAARELAGLLQVALVWPAAVTAVGEHLGGYGLRLPADGAVLVWPDPVTVARHPVFDAADIADRWAGAEHRRGVNALVGRLMRMLGPLSVVAAGTNHLLASANRAVAAARREQRETDFKTQVQLAAAAPNTEAENAELRRLLRTREQDLEELVDYTDQEMTGLKTQIEQQRLEYARSIAQMFSRQPDTEAASDTDLDWDEAPTLDATGLEPLARFLAEASGGAIVFTDAALSGWKSSGYPNPGKMRDQLIRLSQAAVAWRDADGSIGARLEDWFKTSHDLTFAATDITLRHKKIHQFSFEGTTYCREPHLKLDDHVCPSEVGRIYFARDIDKLRFIVNHVGLKLYGRK